MTGVMSNTSPLTHLAAIGHLDLLRLLYGELLIAEAVWEELNAGGQAWPGREEVAGATWIVRRAVVNRPLVTALRERLDSVETHNPASYRGGILRLHYARAQELGPWLDLVAVRGEIVVQFWLKPGEAAVTLEPGEEREVERIPEQLQKFL